MADKRPALGKGLSALIPDALEPVRSAAVDVDIERLSPNQFQPRAHMDDARLAELAESIKAQGVIQPIVVRAVGDRFQIIAGERRWRAAAKAGLKRVPVVVRAVTTGDQGLSLLEMALIENIQRENLNPMEEAQAYKRLGDEFELTQEQIAAAVGKDRATVANLLRLLRLPEDIKAQVAGGVLSMGHARALLTLPDEAGQRRLAAEVVGRGLSVRATEEMVKEQLTQTGQAPAAARARRSGAGPVNDAHTRAAEEQLRLALGTRVRIVRRGTKGRIEIDFVSENELIRIFDALVDQK
jgi:ParB family chromosome partitioning protein